MYIAKKEDAPLEKRKYIFIPGLGTKISHYFYIWKGTGLKNYSVGSKYLVSIFLLQYMNENYNANKLYVVVEIF